MNEFWNGEPTVSGKGILTPKWVTSREVNLFWGNISEGYRDSCPDPINFFSSKEQVLSPIPR
jgi:hypothetical protein